MATITYSQVQELVKQVPEERLSIAYRVLLELADRGEAAEPQMRFLRLPLSERRQILAEQAEQMKGHYRNTAEERSEWQTGDFLQ